MRGFILVHFYIGMLLVSIGASVPLLQVHQEIFYKPVPESFDKSEIWPEYEAVPIVQSHISKRSVNQQTSLHMKSLDNDFMKFVQPADAALFTLNTPIYSIENTPTGLRYSQYTDAMKTYAPRIYKESVSSDYNKRRKRQASSSEDDSKSQQEYYYNLNVQEYIMNNISEGSQKTKRSNNDIVYPEILVIVDYNFFKILGKSVYNTVKYLVGFWNGVDLAYRTLDSPKFRLNIAAILIAEDESALSYIASNKLQSKYLDANSAINNFRTWLYEYLFPIIDENNYDAAVTMTSLQLCDTNAMPGYCKPGTAGLATFSGACNVDDYFHTTQKTAIVNDIGAFNGIESTVHELGHLFGAKHDSDSHNFRCKMYRGSIMDGHASFGQNSMYWSQCSLMEIDRFLKTKGSCLYNKPNVNDRVMPFLPGQMMDANQQCKVLQGTQAAQIDESICLMLKCYQRNSFYMSIITEQYAAPGTPCGLQSMCVHDQCVQISPSSD